MTKIEWEPKLVKIAWDHGFGEKSRDEGEADIQIPARVYGSFAIHISTQALSLSLLLCTLSVTHVPTGFSLFRDLEISGVDEFSNLEKAVERIHSLTDWNVGAYGNADSIAALSPYCHPAQKIIDESGVWPYCDFNIPKKVK